MNRRFRVRRVLDRRALGALSLAAVALVAIRPPAAAIPVPREHGVRGVIPTATPFIGDVLPVGSPLLFVIDRSVSSSKTQAGSSIPIHLRDPLVVNGTTVAAAGTTGTLTVVNTQRAIAPDTDGAVQIRIEPLVLASGTILPVRAIHEFLTPHLSAGQASTRGLMDSTEDIFVPYLVVYQAFRKGRDLNVPAGSLLRIQTAAAIDARDPKMVAIMTPAPVALVSDAPHSDYTPIPLFTPYALHPNAKYTVKPRVTASPAPSASATDAAVSAVSSPDAAPSPQASGALPIPNQSVSPVPSGAASVVPAPLTGQPSVMERAFVEAITTDLPKRFATTQSAIRAGYLRYTNEDATGAISYANRQWTSDDLRHPSQLWYDVRGRLIGADYSVLQSAYPQAPDRFGIDRSRWQTLNAHVHLGLRRPDGSIQYRGIGRATIERGGGTLDAPTAAALVKAGVAPSAASVAFVFPFPAIWDVAVWLVPNPLGAFAEKNPAVVPVHPQPEG